MTYSPLATETHDTAQKSPRSQPVNMIVLHHAATTNAQWVIDVETGGSKQVSSHMVVKDGRRAGIVPEEFRAWSLSDAYWDSRALTVECANESTNGWTISDASHESLAQLVADWSHRYGFRPHRSGDPKTWTVIGHREVYTIHGGSYSTACPGGMNLDWITSRAQQLLAGGFAGGGITVIVALADEKYQGENAKNVPGGASIFNFVDWTLTAVKNLATRNDAIHKAQDTKLDAIAAAIKAGVPVTVKVDEAFADLVASKVAAKIPTAATPDAMREIVKSELAALVLAPRA